jgi:hypothetical protein
VFPWHPCSLIYVSDLPPLYTYALAASDPNAWLAQVALAHCVFYAPAHTHRCFLKPCTLEAPALLRCVSPTIPYHCPRNPCATNPSFPPTIGTGYMRGAHSTFKSSPCEPRSTWPAHCFPPSLYARTHSRPPRVDFARTSSCLHGLESLATASVFCIYIVCKCIASQHLLSQWN